VYCKLSRGFTLIELMIVLVILGVILVVVLPGFGSISLSTRLKTYSNELVGSVYLARGEAIKRNSPVVLCASTDGTTCAGSAGVDWQSGWVVLDPNNIVLRSQQAADPAYSIKPTNTAHTLTFDASGLATPTPPGSAGTSSFKICRKTPTVGFQERIVTVTTIGQTNVDNPSPSSGTCS
jgi:type IV fimbrial biogenesis protein FimT